MSDETPSETTDEQPRAEPPHDESRQAEPPRTNPGQDDTSDEQPLDFGAARNVWSEAESGGKASGGAPASNRVGIMGDAAHRLSAPGAKQERYRIRGWLARYEYGLEQLQERIPSHEQIALQRNRLRENIDRVRDGRDDNTLYNDRHSIIAVLNPLVSQAIGISFIDLCDEADAANAPLGEMGETGATARSGDGAKPLKTVDEVSRWFLTLGPMEQCFALAVTVLFGAPSHKVSRAASDLYEPVRQEMLRREEQAPKKRKKEREGGEPGPESTAPAALGFAELLERTHTVTKRADGAERINWRDDAMAGHMRAFLAQQATTVGMRFGDKHVLDILKEWATTGEEERSWRASLTLAQIWWRQDQRTLLELANEWAVSADAQTWQSAAALLYGAYAAEQVEERQASDAGRSPILDHLRAWSDWHEDDELACVAAYAFGLLGYQWPGMALDGLDELLELGAKPEADSGRPVPDKVMVFALMAYAEIAEAGYIRPLLARLASHAERLAKAARGSNGRREDEKQRRRREARLGRIFFLYIFFAAYTAAAVKNDTAIRYVTTEALPAKPAFPGDNGQDMLLAGVLSDAERDWRGHIAMLLCAMIAEGQHDLTMEILKFWTNIVVREPAAQAARAALRRFAVSIGERLRGWDSDPGREGHRSALALYQAQLRRWSLVSRPDQQTSAQFAKAVWSELAQAH